MGQPNSAFKLFKAWVCYQVWSCASVHLAAKYSGQKIGWLMLPRVFAVDVLVLAAKVVKRDQLNLSSFAQVNLAGGSKA